MLSRERKRAILMPTYSLRHYIGTIREDNLLCRLNALLSSVKTHGFEILSLEPRHKDGGVFVKFKYYPEGNDAALEIIENDLRREAARKGGIPSWIGINRGNVWVVKGTPWREVRTL